MFRLFGVQERNAAMSFSLSTVLNTTIILGTCAGFLLLLLRTQWYKKIPVKVILIVCLAVMLRFLMPFEFPFTITVLLTKIWPHIYLLFWRTVFESSDVTIYLFQVLFAIWAAGSIFLLLQLYLKNVRFKKTVLSLPDTENPLIISALDEVNQRYKHSRPVRIAVSSDINTAPYITGISNPTVVLPDIEWDSQELSFVLGHELTHFYNHHLHIKLACEVITLLYFWNPFVHLLKKQIFKLLELETDSVFTASMNEEKRLAYAECMLNMSRLQYLSPGLGTAFATHGESNLHQRIQMLLEDRKNKKKFPAFLLSAFALLMFLLNFMFIFEASYVPPEIQATTMTLNEQTAYLIHRGDKYDVYYEGEYLVSVSGIFDESIPVYEEGCEK